jgi:hypothetical protein
MNKLDETDLSEELAQKLKDKKLTLPTDKKARFTKIIDLIQVEVGPGGVRHNLDKLQSFIDSFADALRDGNPHDEAAKALLYLLNENEKLDKEKVK